MRLTKIGLVKSGGTLVQADSEEEEEEEEEESAAESRCRLV